MEVDPYSYLIIFAILLFFSAFFSGSETAFFSITEIEISKLRESTKRTSQRVLRFLGKPRQLLVTILIGNTVVNVAAASVAYILIANWCEAAGLAKQWSVVINITVVTFLILIISEITPKIIAVKNAPNFAAIVSPFIGLLFYILYPLSFVMAKFINVLRQIFRFEEGTRDKFLKADEFQALLEMSEEQGELQSEEKEILNSIFEFGDTSVREIMIPRTDMVCVSDEVSLDQLASLIKQKGHTRIPLYSDTIDKVQGIINAKDLLPFVSLQNKEVNILSLARPAIFVPESKKIDDLLRVFQRQRQHMAIVVDEYGGTSGLVTLEDVIEEIVGEIQDEYDKEAPLYRKINDNTFIVNAKIDIDALNDLIHIEIPQADEYETLGGFVLEKTGHLPKEKETIRHNDFLLSMEKVEKNRILLVKIIYSPQEKPDTKNEN